MRILGPLCGVLALACASGPDIDAADRAACESGQGDACYRIAFHLEDVDRRPADALIWYERGCDADYAEACNDAGGLLAKGESVPGDPVRAVDFYRRSCDLGDTIGCRHLAKMHLQGSGIPVDAAKGRTALEWACEAGDQDGCRELTELD